MTWAIRQQSNVNIFKEKKVFYLCCQSTLVIVITYQKIPYNKEKTSVAYHDISRNAWIIKY